MNEINYVTASPRFSVNTENALDDGFRYLNEHGYVVISDVMNQDDINKSKELLWKFLENASNGTVKRSDPDTWSNNWPSFSSHGVINGFGIGQSDFLWSVRSNPNVKHVYARIWNTQQLLVSFDGCGIFRDWHYNPTWKTKGGWNHVDQNPKMKPGRCCIQGFVSLTDQNERTGGLVVYPKSHLRFSELCDITKDSKDFVLVPPDHPIMNEGLTRGKLVHCHAGDLVLWDSRLIHCNSPAASLEEHHRDEPVDLLRIVAYVSMSPTKFVDELMLDEFRKKRQELVEKKFTLTHWSTDLTISNGTHPATDKQSLDKFNAYQKALIFGTIE